MASDASDLLSAAANVSGAGDVLTACIAEVFATDVTYALCLTSSGLFVRDRNDGGSGGGLSYTLPALDLGRGYACGLRCTTPSVWGASASCCRASANAKACTPSSTSTSTAVAPCVKMLQEATAFDARCRIASEDKALIIWTVVLVAVVVLLTLLARWMAKQQQDRSVAVRLASGSASFARAVLRQWRQTTNLVWKNLVLRRRHPVAFFFELFLPVLLASGLLFIANLEAIFDADSTDREIRAENGDTTIPTSPLVCTSLSDVDAQVMGGLTEVMKSFYSSGQTILGLFLLLSYIKFVSTTTTTMVIEKELRVREVMKIMGLSDLTLLGSWLLTTALLSTPLAFVIAAELKFGQVFPEAAYGTLVFLFWSFSLAIVAFCYFIAPWFNKSRTAAIASVLLWLVCYFPFFSAEAKSNQTKYKAALLPPVAFGLAVDDLIRRAQLGTGLTYKVALFRQPITVPSAFGMSCMLIVDTVIFLALGWYFEQVLPQQYGVRKPWYFVFQCKYWSSASNSAEDDENAMHPLESDTIYHLTNTPQRMGWNENGAVVAMKDEFDEVSIEPVTAALSAQEQEGRCMQIRNLRKMFSLDDGEKKTAVDDLSINLYSGQITALLGHNGAGKTTTISMLTGLITPTSGDAVLYGRSIKRDFSELRQIMGICPQHDVLFLELTVEEHLRLFGTMKHLSPQNLKAQVDMMLNQVGLEEKRHVQAQHLSGGQKRKLSVALAFLGDSKLVFLDEPTSGMDPYSRRFTWDLLQKQREDRVIVLTTHFMDEADILGDRIAIMADGRLMCAGSSLFLKNRYGAGYNLTMIKGPDCQVEGVEHFIRHFVADVKCLSNYGSEVVFQLPSSASAAFPSLLQALDQQLMYLRVQQYGISVTTLEEVFLKIARDRDEQNSRWNNGEVRSSDATSDGSRDPTQRFSSSVTTNPPSFISQYATLLKKRWRIAKRDRKSWLTAICIPLLFLIVLTLLPEIDVANFVPDYTTSFATPGQQANCTSRNSKETGFPGIRNCQSTFAYCSLGVINCDANVCCTTSNAASPYYKCNTCRYSGACFNSKCLERPFAKLQITLNAFIVALVVMLGFAFIPASIVAFVVREKNPIQNAKNLQMICGANVRAYWLANWTHDMVLSAVSIVAATILIPVSRQALSGSDEVITVMLLVISHSLSVVPLAHLFSFRYDEHAPAQTALLVFSLCTGGLLSMLSFMCRLINFDLGHGIMLATVDRNYLHWLFLLFPGYSLNNGIYEIATRKVSRSSLYGDDTAAAPSFFGLYEGLGRSSCTECWDSNNETGCCIRKTLDLDVAGAPILYAVAEAIIFTVIILYKERSRGSRHANNHTRNPASRVDEDDDVRAERVKIEQTQQLSSQDAIFIRNLREEYPDHKVALENLCLSIRKGECFGYLGINGAGKSTTLKILTGEMPPTSGFASLGGYDLARQRDQARSVIGYCPQFDSLHDLLTVTEELELYARLKGIRSSQVDHVVNQKIYELGLHEYRNKLTRGLSGGNKRKLSTAIALIGSPRIIFLDEPSTGVDPSSRRKMWDVIAAICASKESCVVLTTHSMEECEALCTRVGILVGGRLKCLGSVEHLKQKFGRGFTVEVKLAEPVPQVVDQLQAQASRIVQANGGIITSNNISRVCSVMGMPDRGRAILNNEDSGWVLNALLTSAKSIPLEVFCNWWACENQSQALHASFQGQFPGTTLVERQGDHFRFQVPKHALRPFQIFAFLEQAKPHLQVAEYSVSETSLEHIFNNMAAEQEEERGLEDYDAEPNWYYRSQRPNSLQSVRSYHRSSSLRHSSLNSSFVL